MRNSTTSYSLLSITFHWLIALAVCGLFGLGFWMVDLSYYDSWYKTGPDIHRSVGMLLSLTVVLSIAWRMSQAKPSTLASHSRLEQLSGKSMHLLLTATLLLILLSGYLISSADGRGIMVFDWFEVPGFGSFFNNQEDKAGLVHKYAAYIVIAAASLHALAALKHHFFDKDKTLTRILGL